jgi:hypothetical protein
MRLHTLIAACLLTSPVHCLATVQAHDSLTFEGRKGFIEQNPVTPLLKKRNLHFAATCTANYSGYLASWTVRDGSLYLSDFKGRAKRQFLFWSYTRDIGLKWLFPNSHGAVLADWFSGELHLNLGDIKLSVAAGHVVATEEMIVFLVKNGKVVKTTRLKYPDNVPIINKRESEFLGHPFDMMKTDW